MKNIFKLIGVLLLVVSFTSCEEDLIIFDNANFVQIDDASATSIVENSGDEVTITAVLGAPQSSDITVNFDVSGADPSRYMLSPGSSVVIPAGQTSATLTFSAVDDDEINGDVDVTIALSSTSGIPVGIGGEGLESASKTITIVDDNVPCNDLNVQIITDRWGCETSWEILDGTGAVVASDGPYACVVGGETINVPVTLEDGCYTFIIYDSYGDGQDTGSYAVTCGNIVHAQGSGDLDNNNQSESTDFCVNQ